MLWGTPGRCGAHRGWTKGTIGSTTTATVTVEGRYDCDGSDCSAIESSYDTAFPCTFAEAFETRHESAR